MVQLRKYADHIGQFVLPLSQHMADCQYTQTQRSLVRVKLAISDCPVLYWQCRQVGKSMPSIPSVPAVNVMAQQCKQMHSVSRQPTYRTCMRSVVLMGTNFDAVIHKLLWQRPLSPQEREVSQQNAEHAKAQEGHSREVRLSRSLPGL